MGRIKSTVPMSVGGGRIELGGGAYLHMRPRSSKWHLYAYVDGDELRRSTGKADPAEAISEARRMIEEARERRISGRTCISQEFAKVAKLYMEEEIGDEKEWLRREFPRPGSKSKVAAPSDAAIKRSLKKRRDVLNRILNYLVPYFGTEIGRKAIDQITDKDVKGYLKWRDRVRARQVEEAEAEHERKVADLRRRWQASSRLQKLHPEIDAWLPKFSLGHCGETVSATAFNTEFAILNAIFQMAVDRDIMRKRDVPAIPTQSLTNQNIRTGFTPEELKVIRITARRRFKEAKEDAIRRFAKRCLKNTGLSDKTAEYSAIKHVSILSGWVADPVAWSRFVLMCSIDILAGTGMRPSSYTGILKGHVIERTPLTPEERTRLATVPATDRRIGSVPAFLSADEVPPDVRYSFVVQTLKGGVQRRWAVVPEDWAWPAVRMLHRRLPDDDRAPLVGVSGHALNDAFKDVLRAAELEIDFEGNQRSLYDLRHYYITQKLLAGVPVSLVAKNTMTSAQMIDRYYDHIKATMGFAQLSKSSCIGFA